MLNADFLNTAKWLLEHRYHPISTVVLCVGLVVIIGIAALSHGPTNLEWWDALIVAGIVGPVLAVWFTLRRMPRARKKSVGFAVSIASYSTSDSLALKAHFIDTLRSLLRECHADYPFDLVVLPQYHAHHLLSRAQQDKYLSKTNSKFLLWGRVRRSGSGDSDAYTLDLQGRVRHAYVHKSLTRNLAKDFTELLPPRVQVSAPKVLPGFEFTSACIYSVAQYVIGYAAFLSRDSKYAQQLFEEILSRSHGLATRSLPEQRLLRRIPLRLAEIYADLASKEYRAWLEHNDDRHIPKIGELLANATKAQCPDDFSLTQIRAIHAFLTGDIAESLRLTRTLRKHEDMIWRFNLAFLYAYQRDLRQVEREYKIGASGPYDEGVPNQIEQFVLLILKREPHLAHLHYNLGLINYYLKEDFEQARIDLLQFLNDPSCAKFQEARHRAAAIVKSIDASRSPPGHA